MKRIGIYLFVISIGLIFISCDKELSTSPPMSPVPVGFVYIDSKPDGALIYEDGRNSGQVTPDSLSWLEEKTYTFTLKKELYRDTSFALTVNDGDSHYIFIDYLKNPKMRGKIYCSSNADSASIYLNDSLLDEKIPFTIKNLVPGEYRLTYDKFGFRKDSTRVIVKSNETSDATILMTDTTTWVDYYSGTSPLPDNAVTSIAIDDNNVKWVGTQSGLVSFDDHNWEIYTASNSPLPDDYITTLEYHNGELWIGTYNGAVVLNNGSWTIYDGSNAPMQNPKITSFAFQDDGTFWIGTQHGLMRHNSNGWFFYDSTKSGIPHRWVTDVDVDDFNNIWVGTKFGLAQLSPEGEWTRYVKELVDAFIQAPFPSNSVSHVKTYKNELWVSFDPDPITKIGGLVKKSGARWYTNFSSLPSHIIYSIEIEDATNRKWISTKEGLLTFVTIGNRKVYRTENSGMLTNIVTDVAFDRVNNNLWVATLGGGFYKFKKGY